MKKETVAFITGVILVVLVYNVISSNDLINNRENGVNSSEVSENVQEAGILLTPISHATFVLDWGGFVIYNDPVGDVAAFKDLTPPDVILVSDIHGDHLSLDTLTAIAGEAKIYAPEAVASQFSAELGEQTTILDNGDSVEYQGVNITAIPMYNTPEQGVDIRHEKGRGNGYLLEYGGMKVYIAGDTARTPEMEALTDVTMAFIPMNLPYTMGVEEAAAAVIAFAPQQVYPYHYRTPDGFSDVDKFKELVEAADSGIEVVQLEWYPETQTEVEEVEES